MTNISSYKFALLCTLIILIANFFVPSYNNGFPIPFNKSLENFWDNDKADEIFHGRYNFSEFRRRPIVIELQNYSYEKLSIPYQFSFNVINYIAFFFVFLLIRRFGFILSGIKTNLSALLMLFTLPILFAFYGSICTYDDVIQYVLLLSCGILLFKNKPILAASIFTLSLISRETSILFYLIVVGYYWIERKKIEFSEILLWMLPPVAYILFLNYYLPTDLKSQSEQYIYEARFRHWFLNFGNFRAFTESVTIILIMTVPFIYLLICKFRTTQSENVRKWCYLSLFFIAINTLIVSTSALVREARLFILPLLFVIPYCSAEISNIIDHLKKSDRIGYKPIFIIVAISFFIAFIWYHPFTKGTGYIFKIYTFFYWIVFLYVVRHGCHNLRPLPKK